MSDEGVDPFCLVRMDHKTGTLVQQHQVFVLIYDIQLGLIQGQKCVFRCGLVEELVVDI